MIRAPVNTGLGAKLYELNWFLPMVLLIVGLVGVAMIYSATGGVWNLGASKHLVRIMFGLLLMLAIALVDIRVWLGLAYPVYLVALALLIGVEMFGVTVNGSQRWLDLGFTRIQPSEFMKLAIVMALARYYHDLPFWRVSKPLGVLGAIALIFLPVFLILRQPDLGTSLLVMVTGLTLVYLAGINKRIIIGAFLSVIIAIPLLFKFALKEYQRSRILTFLDPSRDPMGASYHITQSKIALGSGGVTGKGFQQGTQASLQYVPENRTDFIFTVIGEEFGLAGGLGTMALYMLIIAVCFWLAVKCKNVFSKLLILGLSTTFALYVFVNLGMVMGLMPVVGVPLPLISYGGTVLLSTMAGFGIVLSAHVHRETELPCGSGLVF